MGKSKVMVAVDFSEYSPKIVEYAGRLAERLDAELVFVNVINQRDINMVNKITMYTDKISVESYLADIIKDRPGQRDHLHHRNRGSGPKSLPALRPFPAHCNDDQR